MPTGTADGWGTGAAARRSATTSRTGPRSPGSAWPATSPPRTAATPVRSTEADRPELRFAPGGEPPVGGFWSLTLYGPDLFFVANAIDRFSIGDRTPGLRRDGDGGLSMLVAHQRPDAAANWLPAPDGPGFVVLRCYEGAPAVVEATWFPPPLAPGYQPR